MTDYFEKVKSYLVDLEYTITHENAEESVLVVESDDTGIRNLVIACADPILILEQYLFEMKNASADIYRNLLIKNRDIVHGAFALDEGGQRVIFRDTLQLENLDLNELEGTLNSLSLLLSEYSDELIAFSKH